MLKAAKASLTKPTTILTIVMIVTTTIKTNLTLKMTTVKFGLTKITQKSIAILGSMKGLAVGRSIRLM